MVAEFVSSRREMKKISRRKGTRHVGAVHRQLYAQLLVVAGSRGVEVVGHPPASRRDLDQHTAPSYTRDSLLHVLHVMCYLCAIWI